MSTPKRAEVVSEAVGVPADAAYQFARQMENMPRWASGLATGIAQVRGEWFMESPMGRVKVSMAPQNEFGVLDHEVTLPDGQTVLNAFRVTPLGKDSLLTFVVSRSPGSTDDAFQRDVAHVANDLRALKAVLEAG